MGRTLGEHDVASEIGAADRQRAVGERELDAVERRGDVHLDAFEQQQRHRGERERLADEPELESDVSDESDAQRKRLRPNFLSDVEQTMLLAQMEASQSQSVSDLSAEIVDATQAPIALEQSMASPEKEELPSTQAADHKTPPKAKPATVNQLKSFFSPDPKESIAKKVAPADANGKKTARPPAKSKSLDATQTSIRDMMLFASPAPPKSSMPPTSTQSTPRDATCTEVETNGGVPPERWGFTATKITDDRVVVYGGGDDNEATLGDLHVFDCKSKTWSKPLNCESIPRAWHDAVYLARKHLLLVFGGERMVAGDQLDVLSDIMVLDTEVFLWYPPAVTGVAPTPRSGHACTVVGDEVVVFGGSRGRSRQSAVHVLDTGTWHWKHVKVEGKPPSARTYHSAVALGTDSVVYFGGNDTKKSFDSVHVLTKSKDKPDTWTWFHPCVVGTSPRARTGHSATLLDDSKLLIVGGWDPSEGTAIEVFNDAFVLDMVAWEWEKVDVSGLPGRVGHCAVAHGEDVLLFGGQDVMDRRHIAVHALRLTMA